MTQVELVDQPNIVTVTESLVTVQVAGEGAIGPQGPQGEPGVGAPIYGQVSKMTSGTITIAEQGVYQSTGLTAVLDGEADGIGAGTTDLFAIKNVSGETRRLKVSASYDGTKSGAAGVLGLALAVNGVLETDTECRATTSGAGAIAKLATAWIIDLPDGQEVAMRVANHSNTTSIAFQRGRIVATSVAGFGPQGSQGAQGADSTVPGPQGSQGSQGAQGPQGADSTVPGPQGSQGSQGSQGPQGADSTVPGPQGSTGPQGPQGADSIVPGPQGSQGAQGAQGADSTVPGPQGDTGPQGVAGPQGSQGSQGAQGPQGAAGSGVSIGLVLALGG
jgi:hypothetical protein